MKVLNGWQRLGIIASLGWMVFIFALLGSTYSQIDNFDKATSGFCPRLSEPFVTWVDVKKNKEISIYRPGETSLNCRVISDRAKALRELYLRGEITPEMNIQYVNLVGAITVPIVLLWLSAYFLIWVVKWVIVGFRGK